METKNIEFTSEEELCEFLKKLIAEKDKELEQGKITSSRYEEIFHAWYKFAEQWEQTGIVSDEPRKLLFQALSKSKKTACPLPPVIKTLNAYEAFIQG